MFFFFKFKYLDHMPQFKISKSVIILDFQWGLHYHTHNIGFWNYSKVEW